MRNFILTTVITLLSIAAIGQVDTAQVYNLVDQMPLIPTCGVMDTSYVAKQKCTQDLLLDFIYRNVQYPDSARYNGIEGMVVLSFVIGRDSMIRESQIVKDIGGGCGAAALYVINAMNPMNLRWMPGQKEGVPVDVRMTIPVKFKIKELPPYVFINGDTVYTELDKPLTYKGGMAALDNFITTNKKYPDAGNTTCSAGTIETKILVKPSGGIEILEMLDFSNLGVDFQFEAISAINATIGQWEMAEYNGRKVPTSYVVRIDFQPTVNQCEFVASNFKTAQELVTEGSNLFNEGAEEEGLEKLSEAINLFPDNAEYLYARGQAYLELNQMDKACIDLTKMKELLLVSWVDNLLPLICNPALNQETDGN